MYRSLLFMRCTGSKVNDGSLVGCALASIYCPCTNTSTECEILRTSVSHFASDVSECLASDGTKVDQQEMKSRDSFSVRIITNHKDSIVIGTIKNEIRPQIQGPQLERTARCT